MLWGFSPALDLLDEIKRHGVFQGKKELNVLIVGAADARHILKTLSKVYTHETDVVVNFYTLDVLVELVARQMLLMTIALEPGDRLGLSEKVRLWMEVYGNSLLRPTSAEYLVQKSYQLLQMATDPDFLRRRMPCISLDLMKYKEKDQLETVFRYWTDNDFNIIKNWDLRLRKSLETRYDAKLGVFDWDYHMKLKEKEGTEVINSIEYKQWRNTGVAFTWLETEYSLTNPTLALGIFPQGDKIHSHGFCGDMEFGPYFTFGTECEDKEMFQKKNGVYRKRATDVIERNLTRLFHEIETDSKLEFVDGDRDMGTVVTAVPNLDTENEAYGMDVEIIKTKEDYAPIPTRHNVNFLPLNALEVFPEKEKFRDFFDLMFFAQGLIPRINENVLKMLKPDAPLLLETRMYCFTLTKDSMKEFETKVKDAMNVLGLEPIDKCDMNSQSIVRFKAKPTK
ncbi:dynein assembly factor 3, axonemal [Cimex lectularius]|uniref:Dynein assembly factor 3, axonemal homolog n=1 Tax=Cimex lectularius TaxID=79782 RepID=A0A8I6REM8_CIMLE|nr:dynein assembly factor 3, axonemal [Cimex lectularius]